MTRRATGPRDDLGHTMGSAIRARRLAQGVTMQVLADRAELSQPFLSKVERGMARLSMRSLDRVAHALGTSAVGLFAGMAADLAVEVVRRSERPMLPEDDDSTVRITAHALTRRPGQLRIVEFEGGPTVMSEAPFVHRNDALSLIMEGTYEFEADGQHFVLEPGDTLCATGGVAHRYRVLKGPARMMLIIVSEDVQVIPDPIVARRRPRRRTARP